MEEDNETTICILILGLIILIYNFSEDVKETFVLDNYKCPIYKKRSKLISIVHHPRLNKGFIILISCPEAISIIQKSLKDADGIYTIEKNGGNYSLVYNKEYILQNIMEYSLDNYEYIKNKTGFTLMGPT